MRIEHSVSLKPFNTFGLDCKAKLFGRLNKIENLNGTLLEHKKEELLILGGGSNILLTKDFDGLVLKNEIKGFTIISENEDEIIVEVGAGEIWHEFVLYAVNHNWGGIENLSLIPGSVGAAPMQNIGAYGVELKDTFLSLKAYHIHSGQIKTFTNQECNFGYRTSIFKTVQKGNYLILSAQFKLSKKPIYTTSYGAIESELEKMKVENLSIKAISDAVINIRKSKLPDPNNIGNSGSFFKNPIIPISTYNQLLEKFHNLPSYKVDDHNTKIPAAWLIEKAGWKGKVFDNRYGVHKNQALVLVNYGNATGSEIYDLAEAIQSSVIAKFGIPLEKEVNII